MLEKVKAGNADLGNVQTARDDEDRWSAEYQSFQPSSRMTGNTCTRRYGLRLIFKEVHALLTLEDLDFAFK